MLQRPGAAVLLNRKEVAALVGCHPETIKRAERKGKLPAYRFGHRMVRYRREDVERWWQGARCEANPTGSALALITHGG
jgi:excisionase family DNA binding protein